MRDTVVYEDAEFFILKNERIFSTGFNVYRKNGSIGIKQNDALSWFSTFDAAYDYITEIRK